MEEVKVVMAMVDNNTNDLIEIEIVEDEASVSSLASPRLELEGVVSEEEILFLQTKICEKSETTLPLYIVYGLDKVLCGEFELSLSSILELRHVGSNHYTLTVYDEIGSVCILNPTSNDKEVNQLLNFIRVR